MSGGSFDYLYYHLEEAPISDTNLETLNEMIRCLDENNQPAAQELRELHEYLTQVRLEIQARLTQELLHIIRGVEWWRSGDWNRETFEKAWREYAEKKGSA